MVAAGGWVAETSAISSWRPAYRNPTLVRHQTFVKDGRRVGLYVGYYRQQSQESELVTSTNQLVAPTRMTGGSSPPAGGTKP